MRVTLEIDAKELKEVQQLTGQKKKSPALSSAISAYIRQQRKRQFLERVMSGQTDYALTNRELEDRDVFETR